MRSYKRWGYCYIGGRRAKETGNEVRQPPHAKHVYRQEWKAKDKNRQSMHRLSSFFSALSLHQHAVRVDNVGNLATFQEMSGYKHGT